MLKSLLPACPDLAKKMLPSFAGVLEVKHYIRGRLRLRVPSMRGDSRLALFVEKALGCVRGIESVSANPILGTVLVKFDERAISPEIVITAVSRCFDFQNAVKSRRSIVGNELKVLRFSLDQAVMQKTFGFFDLRSALSLMLIFQLIRGVSAWKRGSAATVRAQKQSFPIALIWWLLQCIGHDKF